MKKLLRSLSALLLISALAGLATLLVFDALNHLRLTSAHQRVGALSFMMIGASYISLQLSTGRRRPKCRADCLSLRSACRRKKFLRCGHSSTDARDRAWRT